MDNKSVELWAATLLLVGGLIHLIPALYEGLTRLTADTPWVQIVLGMLSIIVALVMFVGDTQTSEQGS